MHNLHLMTPQGHPVHLALVYGQSLHICGKIIKIFKFIFYSFYLTFLDLLDITSERKLAHIQRPILLNCHFNSITDIPVGTCPLAICNQSVLLVPKLILFYFIFFQNTVVSIQLGKNTYTWFSHQDLPLYNSHMDANDNFGMLNRIATVAKSNQIHVFLSCK